MSKSGTCVVPNCPSKGSKGTDIKFFTISGRERSKVWLKACNREDLLDLASWEFKKGRFKICELHFEEKYMSQGSSRTKLFTLAVPTIFPTIGSTIQKESGVSQIHNGTVKHIDYTAPTSRMENERAPIEPTSFQVFKVDIQGQQSVLTPVNAGLKDIQQLTPIPGPFASTTPLFKLQEFARTLHSGQNSVPKIKEEQSKPPRVPEKVPVQSIGPVLDKTSRVRPPILSGSTKFLQARANECLCEFKPPIPPLVLSTPNRPSVSTSKLILRKHVMSRKPGSGIPKELNRIKSLQREVVLRVTESLKVNV